ncbi:MAG: DUF4440 domain-containing protein [Bacteroidaceae bacterium]|nr:DUF4440 domain-containing protein [Bacteroidaceae bacterium]
MRRKILFITLSCMGLFLTEIRAQSIDEVAEKAAIERLIGDYLETINTCDTALVNRIWLHSEEVSFIAPSGRYSTYNEIRDDLVVGLFGRNFIKRDLQKADVVIHITSPTTAWSEFRWKFDAIRADHSEHHGVGQETQLFKKDEKGQWRLQHVHYSSMR